MASAMALTCASMRIEPRRRRFRHRSRTGRSQLVGRLLRCLLEIVEGTLLLRGRLNYLFDAFRWHVDEAGLLTTQGCHITGRTSALSRTVHRVEPLPLFVAQRLVKLLKRREDNLYGFDGRIQSLFGGVQATDRCERNRSWARRFDDFPCLRRCSAEIVESRFLISCRMDDLSDLIDRQISHGGHQTGATFERRGIGFSARLAISLLGGVAPAGGGAVATAARTSFGLVRASFRLVRIG